ncbi:saccharopine dehydrogenase [Embleya sp. AB8]|uniref:saccharopine dehydrogenase n=1 Tax=Embleya sp. AB8 TaxID=3156304 RepID=UPI003C72ED86
MRHESHDNEQRAPLVPEDAARLVRRGIGIAVEESDRRAFPVADYAAAGCWVAPTGRWVDAPTDYYVLGLKELPDTPHRLRHRHIYFGHAYKGQAGARELLARFIAGGGVLLDLDCLTDEHGRRTAAFGYWAGYVGAALAVLQWRGNLAAPLCPLDRAGLDALLAGARDDARVLVIGALGRAGRGACDALTAAGLTPTRWDPAETREIDRRALLRHDIVVNTVLGTHPQPAFVTEADLDDPRRRIRVIADVTCDVHSQCNMLPIYTETTDWDRPVRRLRGGERPVDLIAIDNLPPLLPVESSRAFSHELYPYLARLAEPDPAWTRCLHIFETHAGTDDKENAEVR